MRFYAPSGETIEHTTPTVEAVVIDCAHFDRRLADAAVHCGAGLVRFSRVTSVTIDDEGVTVSGSEIPDSVRARVLACGASYALQLHLGLGLPRLMLHSAQAELPAGRLGPVEVHFGADIAPGVLPGPYPSSVTTARMSGSA